MIIDNPSIISGSVTGSFIVTQDIYANNAFVTASYALNALTTTGTASYADTASYVDITGSGILVNYNGSQIQLTASIDPLPVNVVAGPGIIINPAVPNAISASVRTVNGVEPDVNGNISVALGSVYTGTSASLIASSSGDITASFANASIWVVSGDPIQYNNGQSFIYQSASVGQWLELEAFEYDIADNRYLMLLPQQSLQGELDLGGFRLLGMEDPILSTDGANRRWVIEQIDTQSLYGTSSYALTASYVELARSASYALTSSWAINAITASYALTSSYALTASYVESASYALTASYVESASYALTASYVLSASYSNTASYSETSSYSVSSSYAETASLSTTSSYSISASLAESSSVAISASYALTASYVESASYALTASYADSASVAVSSSYALTASYADSASVAVSSSYALTSSYADSASVAVSSSYALSSSYADSASVAVSSSYALTASYADSASVAVSSSYALSASYANSASVAVSSSYALSSSFALTASYLNTSLFSREIHVSVGDGSDTNDGTFLRPFKSITKGLATVTSGEQLVIHPGTYTGSWSTPVNANNVTITAANTETGGIVYLSGSLDITQTIASTRLVGLTIDNVIHSGNKGLYLQNCRVNQTFNKTGAGFVDAFKTSIEAPATTSITGAGNVVLSAGLFGVVTVNNASAVVNLANNILMVTPTCQAGTLLIEGGTVYSTGATTGAVFSSAGAVVALKDIQCITPTGTSARITLNTSSFFSTQNASFDRPNSTLGVSLGTRAVFQTIEANNISGSFTGSLLGTGSWAVSASRATTASFALTASYALNGGSGGGASVTISGSIPSGSQPSGSLWWNNNDGDLYIQVADPSGSIYVPAVSNAITSVSASFATTASTTTLSYANVFLGGTWPTANNTDITIHAVSGSGVTAAANVITLQNAGVYTLSANCSIPSNFAEYFWVDTSNVQVPGTNIGISAAPTGSFSTAPVTAAGIITATAGTQIKLRTSIVNGVVADVPYYYNVQIIQIR